jgi:hypothetical protein
VPALGRGEFGHGFGALAHGMLGKLSGQHQPHGRLNLPGRQCLCLVDLGQLACKDREGSKCIKMHWPRVMQSLLCHGTFLMQWLQPLPFALVICAVRFGGLSSTVKRFKLLL